MRNISKKMYFKMIKNDFVKHKIICLSLLWLLSMQDVCASDLDDFPVNLSLIHNVVIMENGLDGEYAEESSLDDSVSLGSLEWDIDRDQLCNGAQLLAADRSARQRAAYDRWLNGEDRLEGDVCLVESYINERRAKTQNYRKRKQIVDKNEHVRTVDPEKSISVLGMNEMELDEEVINAQAALSTFCVTSVSMLLPKQTALSMLCKTNKQRGYAGQFIARELHFRTTTGGSFRAKAIPGGNRGLPEDCIPYCKQAWEMKNKGTFLSSEQRSCAFLYQKHHDIEESKRKAYYRSIEQDRERIEKQDNIKKTLVETPANKVSKKRRNLQENMMIKKVCA